MKAKTIRNKIAAKIEDWLETLPEEMAKKVRNKVIVTGGCIPSMFLREPVNDYDVYVKDNETAKMLAEHYCAQFNKMNGTQVESKFSEPKNCWTINTWDIGAFQANPDRAEHEWGDVKYKPMFLSEHAITLSNKVQIILRFTGDAEEIHKNYDFVHAKCYWTNKDGLVTNTRSLEAILAKELVYTGSRYPLASIFRTRKFIKRGWNMHIGNYVAMAMQLNSMDLTDMDTLRDQLTGVDALYMRGIITACQRAVDNGEGIDESYILNIVNRMMGEDDEDDGDEDCEAVQ